MDPFAVFKSVDEIVDSVLRDQAFQKPSRSNEDYQQIVRQRILDPFNPEQMEGTLAQQYQSAQSFIPNTYYTLDDVVSIWNDPEINENIWEGNQFKFSVYLAALMNKVIQPDDEVVIRPQPRKTDHGTYNWDAVGIFLPCGKVIFEGDHYGEGGHGQLGGEIEFRGDVAGNIGRWKKGGKTRVTGNLVDNDVRHMDLNDIDLSILGRTYCVHIREEDFPFYEMEGGEVEILGHALIHQGSEMYGGLAPKIKAGKITVGKDITLAAQGGTGGEVVIEGNAIRPYSSDWSIGSKVKGTKIVVKGNAWRPGTAQLDGELIIEGDSYDRVAWDKKGGTLILKGKTLGTERYGPTHCFRMEGGTVVFEQDLDHVIIQDFIGGKIETKGNLTAEIRSMRRNACLVVHGDYIGDPEKPRTMELSPKHGTTIVHGAVRNVYSVGREKESGGLIVDGRVYLLNDSNERGRLTRALERTLGSDGTVAFGATGGTIRFNEKLRGGRISNFRYARVFYLGREVPARGPGRWFMEKSYNQPTE